MLDFAGPGPATATIAGIKTEIVKRGSGPALLFLHPEIGLAPEAAFIDRLAQKFTVVAASHPGYGRTELPRAFSSVDDLAYFYLDLMEALDLRHVLLVGVSFGGWIAAEIATKTCERVARIVLVNPVGIKTGDREHRDMADIFSLPQKTLEASAFHDPAFARFDPARATEEEIYIRLRNRESTVLFGWSPYMYNPKLAARLHRIKVPALVMWGESDRIAPESYGRAFAERIPDAQFETIAKAGRFPHIERPDEFAARIAAFAVRN